MSRASSETRRPCPPPLQPALDRRSGASTARLVHCVPSSPFGNFDRSGLRPMTGCSSRNSSFERGVCRPVETRQTAQVVKEKAVIALMLSVCSIVEGAACRELQPIPLQPNTTMMGCLMASQIEGAKWIMEHSQFLHQKSDLPAFGEPRSDVSNQSKRGAVASVAGTSKGPRNDSRTAALLRDEGRGDPICNVNVSLNTAGICSMPCS